MIANIGELMRLLLRNELADLALWIVNVAEHTSLSRAVANACGLFAVINEMSAQGALLDDALVLRRIVGANAIRAGHDAILAANAFGMVDKNDAVLTLIAGTCRTYAHALGIVTVLAGHRQVIHLKIGICT